MSMTSNSATGLSHSGDEQPLISRAGWLWIGGIGAMFVVLHYNFLVRMFRVATGEWGGDWSHALIVPLIGAYFINQNRDRLAVTPRRAYWPGLLVLFVGLFSFAWCIYPVRNDMLQGYSMIVSLMGLVLFLLGPAMMRVLWFPIAYLALGVKVSERFWEQIAWQLQLIAAKAAALALQLLGVDATVSGSTIELVYSKGGQWVVDQLNVAEACSGLRMLMAFVALGAAMAYLVERAWWKRVVMLLLAVPIAVLVNIARVTAVGLLSTINKQMATGDFHIFVGMLMLIPAAGLFMLVGWVLDNVVIDEQPANHPPPAPLPEGLSPTEAAVSRSALPMIYGGLLGAGLAVMIGVEYALLLAIDRPEDLFGGRLNTAMAMGLSLVGLVVLAVFVWVIRRLTRPDSDDHYGEQRGSTGASLGVAAGVLLAAVLGLNGVVAATKTVLIKQAVPIRLPLHQIPRQVGTWMMIEEEPRLRAEALEALGTRQYITRRYRDQSWPNQSPESVARLHVAYYTGTPDTVPHVPDRCYVAGGMQRVGMGSTRVELSGPAYRRSGDVWLAANRLSPIEVQVPEKDFDATIFTFNQQDHPSNQSNVIYFFIANGKFLPTPEWVRATAFDPRDRYSYYCKVEVGMFGVVDPETASERAGAFLSAILPEIMACMPDWAQVQKGQ